MKTDSTNPNFEWSAQTLCFDPKRPNTPKAIIEQVPSVGQSINLPGFTGHAGRPINANLALYFIKNFLDHYQISFFDGQEEEAEKLADSEKAPHLLAHYKLLHAHAKKVHGAILNLRYGITLEKDMILKTISQPNCEGLRFYLCARTAPELDDPHMHISLVAVGVDKDGYDLNYQQPNITDNAAMPQGKDVSTNSLTLEYMPPPPYSAAAPTSVSANVVSAGTNSSVITQQNGSTSASSLSNNVAATTPAPAANGTIVSGTKSNDSIINPNAEAIAFFNRFILFNIAKYGDVNGDPVAQAADLAQAKAFLAAPPKNTQAPKLKAIVSN